MNARQEVMDQMRRQAKALRNDPVFLRFYTAAIVGCSGQYERGDPNEELRETAFTDLERADLLAERALFIAVSAFELLQDKGADERCEEFNSKLADATRD
jgi:hypothetical protein